MSYDPNNESKTPFLKNNINNGGVSGNSTGNNANPANSNSNNHNMGSGTTNNMKNSNRDRDLEFDKLQATIGKLRTWLFAITAVAIAGFVILIILVSCLYASLNYDLNHHHHKPKVGQQMAAILEREELCLPCEDFTTGPSREEENMLKKFTQKDTPTGLSCCVDQPLELIELLKLYVERRLRQETARGTINPWPRASNSGNDSSIKYAAHLMMTDQNVAGITQMRGRQYTIGSWIHNHDLAFIYGLKYRHGRIVITEDGLYFVYSQISFMEVFDVNGDQSGGSSDTPSLSHYLYRYNINYHNGGEEKLAQNSITKCWGQHKTYGEYTSNLGAVFHLRRADEIFIKVSNITIVATNPKLSYFGLFKV